MNEGDILLREWVEIAENMRANMPVDQEQVETLITRSKDHLHI